jgi:hypothetical protein
VEIRLAEVESVLDEAETPRLISVPGINFDVINKSLKGKLNSKHDLADKTTAERFERHAIKADSSRLIQTLYAIESRECDLLVSHFFCLDLMQHLWSNSEHKMQRWYGLYDHFLSQVLEHTTEDDTVVIISDHGMQETGIHSTDAFFGSTKPIWGEGPYRVEDLAGLLRKELTENNHSDREQSKTETSGVSEEVTEHLRELGYFE